MPRKVHLEPSRPGAAYSRQGNEAPDLPVALVDTGVDVRAGGLGSVDTARPDTGLSRNDLRALVDVFKVLNAWYEERTR